MGRVEPGESQWTPESLHKLFAAMKRNIPEDERRVKYDKSLKTLDWKKVAFPPFSPKACQIKWSATLQKMRKIRSLTELLAEAEEFISKPLETYELKLHPQAPKKPTAPSSMYFEENHATLRKQHPEMKSKMLFQFALRQYKDLPTHEKDYYKDKFNLAFKEYKSKMDGFRKEYVVKKKTKAKKTVAESIADGEEDLHLQPPSDDHDVDQRSHTGGENDVVQDGWPRCLQTLSETEHQDGEQRQESSDQGSQTATFCENAVGLLEEQKKSFIKSEPSCRMILSETEDEDVEDSSSEDEPNYVDFNEEEEDDDTDDDDDDITL